MYLYLDARARHSTGPLPMMTTNGAALPKPHAALSPEAARMEAARTAHPDGTEMRQCLDATSRLPWDGGVKRASFDWCLSGVGSNRGCTNLIGGHATENSPIVFPGRRGDEVVVCRTPKVGSTMLKSIALAQANQWRWRPARSAIRVEPII